METTENENNKNNQEDKDNDRIIKNLENHIENSRSNLKYSLDRLDILVITLSSGGLVYSTTFIKDIINKNPLINSSFIKIAWALFGFSIISNLFSQVTGYYANKFEIKITKNIIREKQKKELKGNQMNYECIRKITDFLTHLLNGFSLIMLIIAIILLIFFVNTNFK